MSTLTGIRYDVADGVARITLARPRRANALDLPTAGALTEVVALAGSNPEVRVVLLAGEGPRFCAGGGVAAMAAEEAHHWGLVTTVVDDESRTIARAVVQPETRDLIDLFASR